MLYYKYLAILNNKGEMSMEDRFLQQLKKGVLEMLVLKRIAEGAAYGYELMLNLKEHSDGLFCLKEGTLYPILYRLEDDGMIRAAWSQGEGRVTPKKIYEITEKGIQENIRRQQLWKTFSATVDTMIGRNAE